MKSMTFHAGLLALVCAAAAPALAQQTPETSQPGPRDPSGTSGAQAPSDTSDRPKANEADSKEGMPDSSDTGMQSPDSKTGMQSPDSKTGMQSPDSKTGMQSPGDKTGMKGTSGTMAKAPKLDTAEVTKIAQSAMTHIKAADAALAAGKKSAAKAALAKSEKALGRLYNTPAGDALLNELDEAINALSGTKPALEPMNLAPLSTTVTSYQAYVDPSVSANIKEAQDRSQKGDREGAAESLRLARHRVAIDVALLPVEEAYVRVLAAQRAIDMGNMKEAGRLIRNVPVVVSEVQIAQPLVPIRYKLHAAAVAADAQQWDRTRTLLSEVNKDMQQLEQDSKGTVLSGQLTPIADELEKLEQRMVQGTNPRAGEIREIAKRTRQLGMDDDQG